MIKGAKLINVDKGRLKKGAELERVGGGEFFIEKYATYYKLK